MKVGDLVKYRHHKKLRFGVILKILPRSLRDDNILVQWNEGRAWCVAEAWIETV